MVRHFRKDAPGFLLRTHEQYGDVAFLRLGGQDVYLLSHPEYIRDVLVTHQSNFTKSRVLQRSKKLLGEGLLTSEGQLHLRQRRMIQPAFHREKLRGYATAMTDWAVRTRDRWQAGQVVDMSEEMARLTLGIVGQTLFSANVEEDAPEVGRALSAILEMFNLVMLPYSELLEKLPLPFMRRFNEARDTLDRIVYRIIGERRASGEDTGDLLSMLLMARDEEDDGAMSDEQVRNEALTLFLAGHETTANALTWSWYLLSQHPEIAARMRAEIGTEPPGFEDLPRLKYVEMVLAEALRLYPPAWAIGRKAIGPYKIGDRYECDPGSIMLMSPYVMHRDAKYFPKPERFDPDRWLPENVAQRPKFSYVPFGGGTRVCIGERFAWMEGVLLLATIAQRWSPKLVAGHVVRHKALLTLRPEFGMKMVLEPVAGA
ncbi:cytochrome P450 [Bryobacterales bacterium F-183]|nr:cytochrome P450 [Bryobacterales bacterium F-183]